MNQAPSLWQPQVQVVSVAPGQVVSGLSPRKEPLEDAQQSSVSFLVSTLRKTSQGAPQDESPAARAVETPLPEAVLVRVFFCPPTYAPRGEVHGGPPNLVYPRRRKRQLTHRSWSSNRSTPSPSRSSTPSSFTPVIPRRRMRR